MRLKQVHCLQACTIIEVALVTCPALLNLLALSVGGGPGVEDTVQAGSLPT